jgi:hypothetical protein
MVTACQARWALGVLIKAIEVAVQHVFHQWPETILVIIRFGHGNLDPFKLLTCDCGQLVGDPAGLRFRDDTEANPEMSLELTGNRFGQSHLKHVSRTCSDQVKAGR